MIAPADNYNTCVRYLPDKTNLLEACCTHYCGHKPQPQCRAHWEICILLKDRAMSVLKHGDTRSKCYMVGMCFGFVNDKKLPLDAYVICTSGPSSICSLFVLDIR